jgi:hypothetical protein
MRDADDGPQVARQMAPAHPLTGNRGLGFNKSKGYNALVL